VRGSAFFFQADSLLLPADVPDSQLDREIPLDLLRHFEARNAAPPERFEIPAIAGNGANSGAPTITGVCVSPAAPLPPGWRAVAVRQGLSLLSDGVLEGKGAAGRLLRAYHIAQWRRESRFC
jgi:NAD+ diphosphatase